MGAKVAMNFTKNELSASIAIEKMKNLGAVLELPSKQHCQSRPFTSKLGQIGQIGSAGKYIVIIFRALQILKTFQFVEFKFLALLSS